MRAATWAITLGAAGLAACSPGEEADFGNERALDAPAGMASPRPIDTPAPYPTPEAARAELPSPTPQSARYVGRWAASEALCLDGAWRFEERRLATAGEVSCTFDRVSPIDEGYDLEATCRAEGPPARETIRLRFPQDANRMRVESKTFPPIELQRCG